MAVQTPHYVDSQRRVHFPTHKIAGNFASKAQAASTPPFSRSPLNSPWPSRSHSSSPVPAHSSSPSSSSSSPSSSSAAAASTSSSLRSTPPGTFPVASSQFEPATAVEEISALPSADAQPVEETGKMKWIRQKTLLALPLIVVAGTAAAVGFLKNDQTPSVVVSAVTEVVEAAASASVTTASMSVASAASQPGGSLQAHVFPSLVPLIAPVVSGLVWLFTGLKPSRKQDAHPLEASEHFYAHPAAIPPPPPPSSPSAARAHPANPQMTRPMLLVGLSLTVFVALFGDKLFTSSARRQGQADQQQQQQIIWQQLLLQQHLWNQQQQEEEQELQQGQIVVEERPLIQDPPTVLELIERHQEHELPDDFSEDVCVWDLEEKAVFAYVHGDVFHAICCVDHLEAALEWWQADESHSCPICRQPIDTLAPVAELLGQ